MFLCCLFFSVSLSKEKARPYLFSPIQKLPARTQTGIDISKEDTIVLALELLKPSTDMKEDASHSHIKNASHGDIPYPGPILVSGSSGFAWAKGRRLDHSSIFTRSRSNPRSHMIEPSGALHLHCKSEAKRREYGQVLHGNLVKCSGYYELAKHGMLQTCCELEHPDASNGYHI